MMSRLAILLGNPKAKDAPIDLKGVDNDMDYWEHFLESEQGGLWDKETEIKRLKPQSKQDLLPYIANLAKDRKLDYLMFVFAGHGKSEGDADFLYVNPEESVSVNNLKNLIASVAHSGLLFLDACRTTDLIYQTTIDIQSLGSCFMNCSSVQQNTEKDANIKDKIVDKWWNKWADGNADSFVVIQSCARGDHGAVEVHELTSDKYYGAFTKMMLDTAYAASTYTDSYKCFQDANDKMKESLDWSKCDGYTQQATYEPEGMVHPFALGMDTIKEIRNKYLLTE